MKSSKKVVAFSLAAAMLFGNVMGVFAANSDTEQTTTDNKITFTGGATTEPTDPVNPENPNEPADPQEPEIIITGNTGELRLDLVPQFNFGTHQIETGTDRSYPAVSPTDGTTSGKLPYYVQVTDVSGSGDGWTVSAKMTQQFTDSSDRTLDGAKIVLTNAVASAQTGTIAPTTVNGGTLEYDAVNDKSIVIAKAAANEGMGVSTVRFGNSTDADASVNLTIPAATTIYASEYKAHIQWTLAATP